MLGPDSRKSWPIPRFRLVWLRFRHIRLLKSRGFVDSASVCFQGTALLGLHDKAVSSRQASKRNQLRTESCARKKTMISQECGSAPEVSWPIPIRQSSEIQTVAREGPHGKALFSRQASKRNQLQIESCARKNNDFTGMWLLPQRLLNSLRQSSENTDCGMCGTSLSGTERE